MKIIDLLTLDRIRTNADIASKKRALEMLSEVLASGLEGVTAAVVFSKLIGRERLGSTGLGHGVALPHARIEGIAEARGALIKLPEGIDFDAFDKQPVDLLFALIVPEHFTDEHLQILADLAELFSDPALCESLRRSDSAEDLYQILLDWHERLQQA